MEEANLMEEAWIFREIYIDHVEFIKYMFLLLESDL